jgi:hypothetical protein
LVIFQVETVVESSFSKSVSQYSLQSSALLICTCLGNGVHVIRQFLLTVSADAGGSSLEFNLQRLPNFDPVPAYLSPLGGFGVLDREPYGEAQKDQLMIANFCIVLAPRPVERNGNETTRDVNGFEGELFVLVANA